MNNMQPTLPELSTAMQIAVAIGSECAYIDLKRICERKTTWIGCEENALRMQIDKLLREKMIEVRNAVIKSASITSDDHGLLSAWLILDYGGSGQGFGGYALYLPKSFKHHELKSVAGHFIWRVLEIADATEWSELVGKTIRVRGDRGGVEAIGHIVKDDWFCPSDDFAEK